jgi:hypothetical protein
MSIDTNERVAAEVAGIVANKELPSLTMSGRPSWCFARNGDTTVILMNEVSGYQDAPYHMSGELDTINEMIGVDEKQAKAMFIGSMFGWDVPGADPSYVVGD